MANKRTIKKAINAVCESLFAEAIAASLYGNEPRHDNADTVLSGIIRMEADYLSRVSHIEPGMKAKLYFADLRKKFSAEVIELTDQINNL